MQRTTRHKLKTKQGDGQVTVTSVTPDWTQRRQVKEREENDYSAVKSDVGKREMRDGGCLKEERDRARAGRTGRKEGGREREREEWCFSF